MKWVKLTLLEAAFLKEAIEMEYMEESIQAIELLDAAIENAVEEEIEDG